MHKHFCLMLVALTTAGTARADDKAEMKALVDKAITAMGGKDKLAATRAATFKAKGKFYGMGNPIDFTADYALEAPERLRFKMDFEVNAMKLTILFVFDGKQAWRKINNDTKELSKEEFAEAKEDMNAARVEKLLPLVADKDFELSPLGEIKVDDKPAVGVRVTHKGYRDVNLFFDRKTGLLVKSERTIMDQMQGGKERKQETLFSDYKEIGGVKRPMKVDLKRDGDKFVESELSDYESKDMLDPTEFAKP